MIRAMKKAFAAFVALISAIVVFLPFDLPPIPFFFIDEAIALVLLTKSLRYLGIDITQFLPFIQKHKQKRSTPAPGTKAPVWPEGQRGPTIDV
jgi:hypothetical protein